MNRLARIAVAAVASGALAAWGATQYADGRSRAAWRAAYDRGGPGATLAVGPPPDARAMARVARFVGGERLPPDYASAEILLAESLDRAPLRSEAWLELARLRIVRGDDAAARVALARADALDPGWPSQRLESSRLWALLGDEERSLELADAVAALDDEGLLEAAASMRNSGVPPAIVWTRLHDLRKPAGETFASLLERMRSRNAGAMADLWGVLPRSVVASDPILRTKAAQIFLDPMVPEALDYLWRAKAGGRLQPLLADVPLLAENASLAASPESSDFPLGWSPLPDLVWVWSVYTPPTYGTDHGVLEIRVSSISPAALDQVSWPIYTLLAPACERPIRLKVPVSAKPRGRSVVTLAATVDGVRIAGTSSDWGTEDWQDISVDLPASQATRLVKVSLERQQRGAPESQTVIIGMGGIAAEFPEDATP